MKNSESLQLVKEQLKIKSIEFRKVEENNTTVNKKIKTLITENQEEVKKLKSAIVKKDTEIQQREREIRSSSDRLKEAQELAKNQAPATGIDPKIIKKIKKDERFEGMKPGEIIVVLDEDILKMEKERRKAKKRFEML
ncbi:MAG: hypothetical protein HOD16_04390, partial [Nitrospina sp.]|nr:hypothetical protein [Nitrospina sp.]